MTAKTNGHAPPRRWRKGDRVHYLPTGQTGVVQRKRGGSLLLHWGTVDTRELTGWVSADDCVSPTKAEPLRHRSFEVDLR